MGRHARMLTAVIAALLASLALGAVSASAYDINVRVEVKVPPPPGEAPFLHGLVDRTPVALSDTTPVTVDGVTCSGKSAIAALNKVLPDNLLTVSQSGGTPTIDKIDGYPRTASELLDTEKPSWAAFLGGEKYVADPCAPLEDIYAGSEILVFLKCGPSTSAKSLGMDCFDGGPLLLRAQKESFWPTTPVLTQFALPVYVARSPPGPAPSWTAQLVTDESNVGILVDQVFHDGSARVPFTNPGPHTIVATDATSPLDPTKPGGVIHVPDRIPVCITNGGDGFCGTTKQSQNPFDEGNFPAPCETNGHDGHCNTIDTSGPPARVTNIKDHQVYKPKKGPTTVKGVTNVALDPAGIGDLKLRLTRVLTQKVKVKPKKRKAKKKPAHKSSASSAATKKKSKKKKPKVRYRKRKVCTYWNEDTLLLERAKRCGAAGGKWWSADLSDLRDSFKADFALKLPKGTYLLEVQSSDEDGHLDAPDPGRNLIRFVVK